MLCSEDLSVRQPFVPKKHQYFKSRRSLFFFFAFFCGVMNVTLYISQMTYAIKVEPEVNTALFGITMHHDSPSQYDEILGYHISGVL